MFANFTPPIDSLTCQAVNQQPDGITAHLTSTAVAAYCPLCGQVSNRIHSHYNRRLTDLPVAGQPFMWQLKVYKFFCDNQACDRRIFTERFNQHIQPYARWLSNCQGQLRQLGLVAGGQYGSLVGRLFGLVVSGSTLLRRVRQVSLPVRATPRVLGVDDCRAAVAGLQKARAVWHHLGRPRKTPGHRPVAGSGNRHAKDMARRTPGH